MSRMRIANEWNYGVTGNYFPLVRNFYNMKMLKNLLVSRYYIVATLLRNAQLCLYDGLTAQYFDCPAPSLEEYFRVEDII